MKKHQALILAFLLATTTTAFAARPGDPFEPILKKMVRIVRFIGQTLDYGIIPPHP